MSTKKRNTAYIVELEEWLNEVFKMEYKPTGASTAMVDSEANEERIMTISGIDMSSTNKLLEN